MWKEWLYFSVLLIPIVPGWIVLRLEAGRTENDPAKGEEER